MQSRLIVMDPGHFHATLLQKEMYAALDPRVSVYAPLGAEVLEYLRRVALFNSRAENPTHWALDVHLSGDPMGEMLRDRAGNIVVFAGRNRGKIDWILAALSAGLHVLADKPWIIASSDLPKLDEALARAERKGLAAYDIMTERYEVTSELQRELVNDRDIFGELLRGSSDGPGVRAHSIHNVMKVVAGVPLQRPFWFFDIDAYGEGLADVGTHVVDLVQWTAFPDQALTTTEVKIIDGRRWPLVLTKEQFGRVTGEPDFPRALRPHVVDGRLEYFCNNAVHYTLRGVHVKLEITWDWEAAPGAGDVYEASFRGSRAAVEIRQGAAERFVPEVYVVPAASVRAGVFAALHKTVAALQSRWKGLSVTESGNEARLTIPPEYRVSHETHFAQVARRFFDYVDHPAAVPAWERPCMLAKYAVSTGGVEVAR